VVGIKQATAHKPEHLLSPSLSSIPNGGEGGRRPGEEALSLLSPAKNVETIL
jgi:hypothetical protein